MPPKRVTPTRHLIDVSGRPSDLKQQILSCYQETLETLNISSLPFPSEQTERQPLSDALFHFLQLLLQEYRISRLLTSLLHYDAYTFRHSIAVGLLSCQIGIWMGLTTTQCRELLLAGALHDIGKSRIEDHILNKPGRLTDEEFLRIKDHARLGHAILRSHGIAHPIALVALNHHERLDGRGYPRRLQEPEIDLYSRIVAVSDVFHAMTSKRVYRAPAEIAHVLAEMAQGELGEFDPQVVHHFVTNMQPPTLQPVSQE